MFCGQCGTQVADDAKFCPACGARIESQVQPPASPSPEQEAMTLPDNTDQPGDCQQPPQTPYGEPVPHVKNYLVESILCTICCCLPFGIPGIVFAAQVDSKLKNGDVAGAQEASEKAKKWTLVSFIVGIVVKIAYAVLYGFMFSNLNNGFWYNF